VVGRIRLGQFRKFTVIPGEFSAIDDGAADTGAMTANKFCQRIDNNIGAMIKRLKEKRRGNCVINHIRQTGLMGNFGNCFKIINIVFGIADRLTVHKPGIAVDRLTDVFRI
jgi:hypothetical protein